MLRVGIGEDIHRLVEKRDLLIGGIKIPSSLGEDAHSDGDVLIHAIIDALFGSASLGDIGTHFPESDPKYKDIDSKELLKTALKMAKAEIINIDAVVELEKIPLKPYIYDMRKSLSEVLSIDINRISIKAKTNEALGPIGEGRAIKATCVLLAEYP